MSDLGVRLDRFNGVLESKMDHIAIFYSIILRQLVSFNAGIGSSGSLRLFSS